MKQEREKKRNFKQFKMGNKKCLARVKTGWLKRGKNHLFFYFTGTSWRRTISHFLISVQFCFLWWWWWDTRGRREKGRERTVSVSFFLFQIFFFSFCFHFISFLFFIRNEKQCKTTDKCRQQREASQAKDPGNYKMTFGSDRDENTERKKKNGAKKTLKKIVFAK